MFFDDLLYFSELLPTSSFYANRELRGCIALSYPCPCAVAKIDANAVNRHAGVAFFLEVLRDLADHFRFFVVVAVRAPFGGLVDLGVTGDERREGRRFGGMKV